MMNGLSRKWKSIGSMLDVKDEVLDEIEQFPCDDGDRLRKVLTVWDKHTEEIPPWNRFLMLIQALNKENFYY